jgi:hypothetical protein
MRQGVAGGPIVRVMFHEMTVRDSPSAELKEKTGCRKGSPKLNREASMTPGEPGAAYSTGSNKP